MSNVTLACRGFRCNSGQCIEQAERCDGVVDCRDKSDETFCSKYDDIILITIMRFYAYNQIMY